MARNKYNDQLQALYRLSPSEEVASYWDYLNSLPEQDRKKDLNHIKEDIPDFYNELMSQVPDSTSENLRLITNSPANATSSAAQSFQEKKSKLNIEDFDIKKFVDSQGGGISLIDKETGETIGRFPYRNSRIDVPELYEYIKKESVALPEHITMDYPKLEKQYRKRGLGEQAYKKIEEITGKKILPDTILSSGSSALHQNKGLGKSFGKQEYGPDIIRLVNAQLRKLGFEDPEIIERLSKNAFKTLKNTIVDAGVTDFKSVAPLLVKGGIAAGTGALSLAAEAAMEGFDAESLNDNANANRLLDIQEGAEKFKKSFPSNDEYYKFEQNIKNRPIEEKIPLEINNKFPKLKQNINYKKR